MGSIFYSHTWYRLRSSAMRLGSQIFSYLLPSVRLRLIFLALPFSWKITAGFWISFSISREKLWKGTLSGKFPRQTASCARYNVSRRGSACHTTAGESLVNWTLRITLNTRRIWRTRKAAITTRQRSVDTRVVNVGIKIRRTHGY